MQAVVWGMVLVGLFGGHAATAAGPVEYPGPAPGEAKASIQNGEFVLSNDILECKWSVADGSLRRVYVSNKQGPALSLRLGGCFRLTLADARTSTTFGFKARRPAFTYPSHQWNASDFKIVEGPEIGSLAPDDKAQRVGARNGGKDVRVILATPDDSLVIQWRVELRDGSNYVRQYVSLLPKKADVDLREIALVQEWDGGKDAGRVDGSPGVFGDRFFFGFEHPLSKVYSPHVGVVCSLPRSTPLKVGEEQTYSSVIGVAPEGQLRRAFLYYVERERAQPYRPFLHYNSWYDIGYGGEKILEADALKVIDLFGRELIRGRGVKLDSFVWDDGWDDPASLWRFHEGFPQGFTKLKRAADGCGSAIGAWLSPWGGYGRPKEERMKYGSQEGFETNDRGFSMAGPKYYARFRDACLGMIRDYDLNYFKFDGISDGGTPTGAAAAYAPDVEALLRLTGDLRKAKPDVFINVTTGTWSSPYWLWYADSTWRSGDDWGTCGWGSKRRQQITYRDAQTYRNVVLRAFLYPLNSLMTQGVMFGNHGLPDEPDGIVEDIRDFFASGTNCQELYITPSLLDARAWDALAEAAVWSRNNADVLVDTHWVGGDPAKGEVYGWASWSKRKGILALRNPKDEPGQIALDIGDVFDLPQGAAQIYSLKSPWDDAAAEPAISLSAGKTHTFDLKPFDVQVFDATPR
jgi:hypothetical protein